MFHTFAKTTKEHRKYKQETNKNAACGGYLGAKLYPSLLQPRLLHRKCIGELWKGKRKTQNLLVFLFLYHHTL